MILFNIPGCPVPWAATRVGKRSRVDPRAREKLNITWHIKLQMQKMPVKFPIKGPIKLIMRFGMQVPHSFKGKKREMALNGLLHHTSKCDLTNLAKLYEDMVQRAGAIENDSNVVSTVLFKFYSEKPHTRIELSQVTETPRDMCR